jgi:hypothetical protein
VRRRCLRLQLTDTSTYRDANFRATAAGAGRLRSPAALPVAGKNGDIRLPADVVVQIARIVGVSTDELLGLKDSAPRAAAPNSRSRRLYRRLQDIEKLPRRDQQALLRTIEAFLSKAG